MVEKIIINGVNVSGCAACSVDDKMVNCNCSTEYSTICDKNSNCYYKQLQRKTAECEKLKALLQIRADETCNLLNKLQIATEALEDIVQNYCNLGALHTKVKYTLEGIKE